VLYHATPQEYADTAILPLALWAAPVLKFDRLNFSIADHWDLFAVGTVAPRS
jgi:hypothetical protein